MNEGNKLKKSIISKKLIQTILEQYTLPRNGIHGISHWARVLENGIRLARSTGASIQVVQLFAVFHDSKRFNEHLDPGHGRRGSEYAISLHGSLFQLNQKDFDLLYIACAEHTAGKTEADITVQTCWDADRLDLARANITPEPRYLCTPAAKNSRLIKWASNRSKQLFMPEFVPVEWGYQRSK